MRYDLWVRPLWMDVRAAPRAVVVMALLRYSSPATCYPGSLIHPTPTRTTDVPVLRVVLTTTLQLK